MRKYTKNLARIAGLMAAVAIMATPQARATLTLGNGNPGLAGATGPFGTVDVTLINGTTADITFTAGSSSLNKYAFGGAQAIDLNVNGTVTFSVLSTTATPTAGGPVGPLTAGGSGNADGFGNFSFRLDSFDGYTHSATQITIELTKTSGTWASAADVLTANENGFFAAAHVFILNSDYSNTGSTGYATTPEPTTLVAGALLLLPFGASTLRILRKNRKA